MDVFDFSGRTIVLTGGAGGIGAECVKVFQRGGARVHVIDPRVDLDERIAAIEGIDQGEVVTHRSALDTPAECRSMLEVVGQPIHGLVHLAGLFERDPLEPGSREIWDRAVAVNLTSAYDLAVAFKDFAAPKETSRLVFISSVAAGRGAPDHAAYSAAKAGLLGLTRSLARRLAPDILVNIIAPGVTRTDMATDIIRERGERGMDEIALGRYGAPTDIAGPIAFLCSDSARFITGQTIQVDGGTVFR